MRIILAEPAGCCFGVERAIRMAEEAIRHKTVFCQGQLIHNSLEVARLEKLGLKAVQNNSLDADTKGAVLIRTHGASPGEYRTWREQNREIIDATCPFVARAQQMAREAYQEGYQVVILGDPRHVEVQGIKAWTDDTALVVASAEDLEGCRLPDKAAVLAQTTERQERFHDLVEYLRGRVAELKVLPTICSATMERQKAAALLAQKAGAMIVIGGKNSSNTIKLLQICQQYNPRSYLVENSQDLQQSWFDNIDTAGVTAGASTPAWIIKEVIDKMEDMNEGKGTELDATAEEKETLQQADNAVQYEAEAQAAEPQAAEPQETEPQVTEPQAAEPQVTEPQIDEPQEKEVQEAEQQEAEPQAVEETATEEQEAEISSMQDNIDIHSFQPGEVISGKVVKILGDEVLVDIGAKSEGIIPAEELSYRRIDPQELVSVGQEIMVEVLKEDREGNIILSRKNALTEESLQKIEEALQSGSVITAKVIDVVKGGVLVDVGIRGFVPASQIGRGFIEDLSQFLHQELRLKVLELDRNNKKVVLSQRAVLAEEARQKQAELWESLKEGEIREGVVKRLSSFGAFVDIGGIDGLLHVSEMGWGRVNNPAEVVKEGDQIEVEILRVDKLQKRISLSLKKLLANPWDTAGEKYQAGAIIEGKVTRIAPFGAFVEIEPGLEGLVHISQISEKRIGKVEEVLNPGQTIKAKVLEVDTGKKRISLSIKEIGTDAEKKEYDDYLEQQEQNDAVTIGDMMKKNGLND